MTLLRNGRGRIRCFYRECTHWASRMEVLPTEWSVASNVPLCDCCFSMRVGSCEGESPVSDGGEDTE